MLKWSIRSDSRGCIIVTGKYRWFDIIIRIFYKDVSFPFSITRIYNPMGECNYSQIRDVWSREEAISGAEEFITSTINNPEVIEISEYLENSHLNYTWISGIDNNGSISLIFKDRIENNRSCTLVGENINMNNVAIKVFNLELFNRHGIRKYTR